jgi:hypothetical protein
MMSPLIIFVTSNRRETWNIYKKCLIIGILTYLIVSFSDGAIQLIPVMAVYWFINVLLISENSPKAMQEIIR